MDPGPLRPLVPERMRHRLDELAARQESVVSRSQVYAAGVTRGQVRAMVRARRWRLAGTHAIALHTGPLPRKAQFWAAVFEGGPRACLDGPAALEAAGLQHVTTQRIRVSVPRGARVRRSPAVDVRQTRRLVAGDVVPVGVPRTRPPTAAVRAALWAVSDAQAALYLTATVQQGLATVEQLAMAMLRVRRDKRRVLLHTVVLDLAGGSRSMSELDLVRGCRERGLPIPTRQAVRVTPSGRRYVDAWWEDHDLVVEVDGVQHTWAQEQVDDALRHNELALEGRTVLRLPLLGLRVVPDEFFAQIEAALRANGWGEAAA